MNKLSRLSFVLSLCLTTQSLLGSDFFVRQNHTKPITSLTYSSQKNVMISTSADENIKIWDMKKGIELKTLTLNGTIPLKSFLVNNDTLLGICDNQGTLTLWDTKTWNITKTFSLESPVTTIFSDATQGLVILGLSNNSVSIFNTSTLSITPVPLTLPQHSLISATLYDSLKKMVYIALENGQIYTINYETLKSDEPFFAHNEKISYLTFDIHHNLVSFSDEKVKIWNNTTLIKEVALPLKETRNAKVLDKEIITCSPSGIISMNYEGHIIRSLNIPLEECHIDNHGITYVSPDHKISLTELQDFHTQFVLGTTTEPILNLLELGDGRFLVHLATGLREWDSTSLIPGRIIQNKEKKFLSTLFLPHQQLIIATIEKGIKAYDSSTFEPKFTLSLDDTLTKIFASDDEKYLLATGEKGFYIIDTLAGTLLKQENFRTKIHSMALTHNATHTPYLQILSANSVHIYDFTTLTKKSKNPLLEGGEKILFSTLSPDKHYMLLSTSLKHMKLYDTHALTSISEWEAQATAGAISKDKKKVVFVNEHNEITLFDPMAKMPLGTFTKKGAKISHLYFSDDERYVYALSDDGKVTIFRADLKEELVDLYLFGLHEWIAIQHDGYYKSSSQGDNQLYIQTQENLYALNKYRSYFYRPLLVERGVKEGTFEKIKQELAQTQLTYDLKSSEPPFIVSKNGDNVKTTESSYNLPLYIQERQGIIRRIQVFVNGIETTALKTRGVKSIQTLSALEKNTPIETTQFSHEGWYPNTKIVDTTIALVLEEGENIIEIVADNGISQERKKITITSEVPSQKHLPKAWVMSIGVNRYSDTKITSLSYPAIDAQELMKTLKKQEHKIFSSVEGLLLSSFSPQKPTYSMIMDNLKFFDKANTNDLLVLFLAGHGMNDEKGNFYFIPEDGSIESGGEIKRSKAISWREIRSILELPQRKLIFIDACHSQGIGGKRHNVDNDKIIRELSQYNAVVLTSSRGNELSQESSAWGHGAFSKAIIEGMEGLADINKDGIVGIKELDAYISGRVEQLTSGMQHPVSYTPEGYSNLPLAKP